MRLARYGKRVLSTDGMRRVTGGDRGVCMVLEARGVGREGKGKLGKTKTTGPVHGDGRR